MKSNKKSSILFMVLFFALSIAFTVNADDTRCQNSCVPEDGGTCSYGTGIPDDPTAFCDGNANYHYLKPKE